MSENDSSSSSVTQWICDLQAGETTAGQKLWERYVERLVRLASRKLGGMSKRVVDEQDVVVTVFHDFLEGAKNSRFTRLNDRNDMWQILVMLTERTAIKQMRHQQAQKRGGGRVRGESVFGENRQSVGMSEVPDPEPTPLFAALLRDQIRSLLEGLGDDVQRNIVTGKLAGKSNKELAADLGISVRSVERKLNIIRRRWQETLPS